MIGWKRRLDEIGHYSINPYPTRTNPKMNVRTRQSRMQSKRVDRILTLHNGDSEGVRVSVVYRLTPSTHLMRSVFPLNQIGGR